MSQRLVNRPRARSPSLTLLIYGLRILYHGSVNDSTQSIRLAPLKPNMMPTTSPRGIRGWPGAAAGVVPALVAAMTKAGVAAPAGNYWTSASLAALTQPPAHAGGIASAVRMLPVLVAIHARALLPAGG